MSVEPVTDTTQQSTNGSRGLVGLSPPPEVVDPTVAAQWLTKNVKNRPLRPRTIERYARDMAAGRWWMTGETIRFDWNGALLNGQHRLHAIIRSGVTLPIHVVRGLDPASQKLMDQGTNRTASDALHLDDHKTVTTLAGMAKLAVVWAEGGFRYANQQFVRSVSHAEILAFVDANPGLVHACEMSAKWRTHARIRPAVLGFTVWLTFRADPTDCYVFFQSVADSRTDGVGDPRLALIRRLDHHRMTREKASNVTEAYYVLRCWNAWRTKEQLHLLKVGTAGGPIVFPKVV